MTKKEVVCFLRIPCSDIVDYALDMANLTEKERMTIEMCGRKGMTQESVAESESYSVESVQKWYASGIHQCIVAWDGLWWIKKLL